MLAERRETKHEPEQPPASAPRLASFARALAFEAPYLVEKLLKDRIASSSEEAHALFREVKRYIVLTRVDPSALLEMQSLRIDEVWHQFILFTDEYRDYCQSLFGGYVGHSPGNAPADEHDCARRRLSDDEFGALYESFFGEPLPACWHDASHVTTGRRVLLNAKDGALVVRDGADCVELLDAEGEALIATNTIAREALAFIAATGAFYVRELPGGLDDDEKVALVASLVERQVLRIAS